MQAPTGTQRRAISLALALSLPDHSPVRIVHQLPHRVRLRPHAGRWTAGQSLRVAAALRQAHGIQSFRISRQSVVVHHSAPLQDVLHAVQLAIAASPAEERPAGLPVPATSDLAPPRVDAVAARQRGARRRMLLCAAATLALTLLPEPVAPAMVLLRLLGIALTAAVRRQAQRHAKPDLLTRVLDALASVAGIVRAERLLTALLRQCAETLFERWLSPKLQHAPA